MLNFALKNYYEKYIRPYRSKASQGFNSINGNISRIKQNKKLCDSEVKLNK